MLQLPVTLKRLSKQFTALFLFSGKYCLGQFDGWSCFLDTPINTVAKASCPPFFEFDTSRKSSLTRHQTASKLMLITF